MPFTPVPATMYLTGCTNDGTHEAALIQPRLGMLAQPGNAIHLQSASYSRWGIDNGVFGKAAKLESWTPRDNVAYLAYLRRVARDTDITNVAFAAAPDVLRFANADGQPATAKDGGFPIGDAQATWEQSRFMFRPIRQLGYKAALVAQDGILESSPMGDSEWDQFDALFLGGSDHFKLGEQGRLITEIAKSRGKWVHMGRVNSLKRLLIAQSFGCDSVDGTFIGFGPDKNLPKVLSWLQSTHTEMAVSA